VRSLPALNTFVIRLPEMWLELPVDESGLREYVKTAAANTEAPADLATDEVAQRRFLLMIDRIAGQARDGGVVFAAGYLEAVPGDDSDDDGGDPDAITIMATAALSTRPAEAFGGATVTVDLIRSAVAPDPLDSRGRRLRDAETLTLPAGPAIRDVVLRRVAADSSETVLVATYYVVIGDGEGVGVLAFQTPSLGVAEELLSLFHSIASTLEFTTV
jgi:hypothetical protein